jgi:hypothetical protein
LITRLESCTKEPDREEAGRAGHRVVWDVLLGLGGAVYVGLVLFDGIESPLLSVVLIVATGYEMVKPHLSRR